MENEYDRWDLLAAGLTDAWHAGKTGERIWISRFLGFHRYVLPFGGCLRTTEAVAVGMGESFRPTPYNKLPQALLAFLELLNETLARGGGTYLDLARVHHAQWLHHFYPDGNKRAARLITILGCARFGLPPVHVALNEKAAYLDALGEGNIPALARLFDACADGAGREMDKAFK